jgi:hypothetical protein
MAGFEKVVDCRKQLVCLEFQRQGNLNHKILEKRHRNILCELRKLRELLLESSRGGGGPGGENPLTTGVKQAVPYRTGREARYLSVSTE